MDDWAGDGILTYLANSIWKVWMASRTCRQYASNERKGKLNKKQTELRKNGQTHIKKKVKYDDALAKHFIAVLNGHFFFDGEEHPDDVQ